MGARPCRLAEYWYIENSFLPSESDSTPIRGYSIFDQKILYALGACSASKILSSIPSARMMSKRQKSE